MTLWYGTPVTTTTGRIIRIRPVQEHEWCETLNLYIKVPCCVRWCVHHNQHTYFGLCVSTNDVKHSSGPFFGSRHFSGSHDVWYGECNTMNAPILAFAWEWLKWHIYLWPMMCEMMCEAKWTHLFWHLHEHEWWKTLIWDFLLLLSLIGENMLC